MNEETARPWRWSLEEPTGDLVIHGPPYPGKDDACDIVLADGAYLCGDDAALIVKAVNRDAAFDALVEALDTARRDLRDYGAAPIQQVREEMKQALEAALSVLVRPRSRPRAGSWDSRNGEAKR